MTTKTKEIELILDRFSILLEMANIRPLFDNLSELADDYLGVSGESNPEITTIDWMYNVTLSSKNESLEDCVNEIVTEVNKWSLPYQLDVRRLGAGSSTEIALVKSVDGFQSNILVFKLLPTEPKLTNFNRLTVYRKELEELMRHAKLDRFNLDCVDEYDGETAFIRNVKYHGVPPTNEVERWLRIEGVKYKLLEEILTSSTTIILEFTFYQYQAKVITKTYHGYSADKITFDFYMVGDNIEIREKDISPQTIVAWLHAVKHDYKPFWLNSLDFTTGDLK